MDRVSIRARVNLQPMEKRDETRDDQRDATHKTSVIVSEREGKTVIREC